MRNQSSKDFFMNVEYALQLHKKKFNVYFYNRVRSKIIISFFRYNY